MDKNFSQDEIEKSLDQLSQWFPKEAESLASYRDELIDHIVNHTSPRPSSPLASVEFAALPVEEAPVALDACTSACLLTVVDVCIFIFGVCGIRVKNEERLGRAILQELGPDTLRGLAGAIHNFSAAAGAEAKAKALLPIVIGIYRAGAFKAAYGAIRHEMHLSDWAISCAVVGAQLIAWFASDGVAFIAEIALLILGATTLIKDAAKVGTACVLAA
jgi:hypothetical protein